MILFLERIISIGCYKFQKNNERVKKMKVLVVGTLPPPIGGTTILLQNFVNALKDNPSIHLNVVDTGSIRGNGIIGLARLFRILLVLPIVVYRSDVVTFHCCTPAIPSLGFYLLLLSKIYNVPFILRKFAGTDYRDLGLFRASIAEFVLRRVDLYLAETKNLVEQAKNRNIKNVEWFPNHRVYENENHSICEKIINLKCLNFIYVGQVCQNKGVNILVEAAMGLPKELKIDVYGPVLEDFDITIFKNNKNITYRGILKPDEVISTMRMYDALVFPTFHDGEGYPGVVLEAFIAGLPVITTKWRALPELVDESVGILVEPRNSEELKSAMILLFENPTLFHQLCLNTHNKAIFFSLHKWMQSFILQCQKLVSNYNLRK